MIHSERRNVDESTNEYDVKNGLVIDDDGTKEWYLNGKMHREDGPAIEDVYGNRWWYLNDELHREDGPAIERANGTKEWFWRGERISCKTDLGFKRMLKKLICQDVQNL